MDRIRRPRQRLMTPWKSESGHNQLFFDQKQNRRFLICFEKQAGLCTACFFYVASIPQLKLKTAYSN
jgi:hypothetical protein